MASPSYRIPSAYEQVPLRRRASGLSLTLALNLFLLFLLIGLARRPATAPPQRGPTIIGLSPNSPQSEAQEERQPKQAQRARPRLEQPKIVLPVPPTIAPPPSLDMIELTREELQTTDQALAERSRQAESGNAGGTDTPVVGRGPNGETLYAAEWVREPTNRELGNYATSRTTAGVGVIACKTYPGYRVDDCVSLGSSPVSSRVDKVLLAAAWQFKVRPPRKDGRYLVGEWVNIQLTWNVR